MLIALLLCLVQPVSGADVAQEQARYAEIQRLIKKNRHVSGHLVLAIDARTIKEVRKHVSERDIDVLVQLMGDKDYGVASAASSLLALQGEKGRLALNAAARSRNQSIVSHARDTLQRLDDCYNEALRDVMSSDFCPADSPGGQRPGSR